MPCTREATRGYLAKNLIESAAKFGGRTVARGAVIPPRIAINPDGTEKAIQVRHHPAEADFCTRAVDCRNAGLMPALTSALVHSHGMFRQNIDAFRDVPRPHGAIAQFQCLERERRHVSLLFAYNFQFPGSRSVLENLRSGFQWHERAACLSGNS